MADDPAAAAALNLEARLGHVFARRELLERALTHRSFSSDHNERLEFLGDAVLGLAIARLLYERFTGSDEGDLSRRRAHLVREDSLHRVALELGLPAEMRLHEGEARGGGAARPSILADALEALIGAVCVDGGFEAAQGVVAKLFGPALASASPERWRKDAKTELQEWLQARHLPTPAYSIAATHGQAHAQTFDVACEIATLQWVATGSGRSRRMAEQAAAQQLLERIRSGELAAPRRKGSTIV